MKVGEIVAVATTTFTAQSYELNRAPDFGALLRVPVPGEASYHALCYGTQTGAIEPGRHAAAQCGRLHRRHDRACAAGHGWRPCLPARCRAQRRAPAGVGARAGDECPGAP